MDRITRGVTSIHVRGLGLELALRARYIERMAYGVAPRLSAADAWQQGYRSVA